MSYQSIVLDLLSGIDDPALRMNISQTLYYLKGVFSTGRVPEDQIRDDIYDVVKTVLEFKNPFSSPDEIDKEAKQVVEKIMLAIKLETAPSRFMERRPLPSLF